MDAKNKKKWKKLTKKTHTKQAIWFLNGNWRDEKVNAAKEQIWEYTHYMMEIQMGFKTLYGKRKKKTNQKDEEVKEGSQLDQFQAHRFMEHFGETKTAKQLRQEMKVVDLDKNNKMCMTEYLIFKYGKTAIDTIELPQGSQSAEAKAAMAAAKANVDDATAKVNAACDAQVVAQKAAAKADVAERKSEEAEAAVAAAVAELKAQEAAHQAAIEKQQKTIATAKGVVKKNKAKAILAQLEAKDPQPLRTAKITAEAALKKSKKAHKKAKKASINAHAAELSADEAVHQAQEAMKAANKKFERLQAQGGNPEGEIWWMKRTVEEVNKYMPGKRKKRKNWQKSN